MLDNRSRIRRLLAAAPWLILVSLVLTASVLGIVLVFVDERLGITPHADRIWLYGGSGDAAISVLSTIASSAITVAGVVFSATYVAMQLASSQYTPRVVQALARRWSLYLVLGFFLASFTFSLIVLRSVIPADGDTEFVPVISVTMAIVLAMVSVGVFVFFIIYGVRTLQPTFIIDSAARETSELLHRSLSASTEQLQKGPTPIPYSTPDVVEILRLSTSGYFQIVNFRQLLETATEANLQLRIDAEVGKYYFAGEAIASVWPKDKCSPELITRIRDALLFGNERTAEQDIEYGFRRVADIMIKALSSAINDPTTAEYCLNSLGDLVIVLANSPQPQRYLLDSGGVMRIVWESEPFDRCVHTAFDQLRFYVTHDVTLAVFALDAFQRITLQIPEAKRTVLWQVADKFLATVLTSFIVEQDRTTLMKAGAWLTT